jgi:hypothetical protein
MHEQARYPHLLDQDAPILTAYLLEHGHRYHTVFFDVQVGQGRDPGPDYQDNIRNMAIRLSRRRIDALGLGKDTVDIIEITEAAGTTAIGQLITYQELYIKGRPNTQTPRLIIAARSLQTDMQPPFDALDIEVHLYPDA